jgi:hypothetical protein
VTYARHTFLKLLAGRKGFVIQLSEACGSASSGRRFTPGRIPCFNRAGHPQSIKPFAAVQSTLFHSTRYQVDISKN